MREPQFVQDAVCVLHCRGNPRALLPGPLRCGTRMDDAVKCGIESHREHALAERFPQTVADVEIGWNEHRTRVGREPQERPALAVRPGKKPLRVGGEQSVRAQVAAVGQEAVGVGLVWVWECQAVGEPVNWHKPSGMIRVQGD